MKRGLIALVLVGCATEVTDGPEGAGGSGATTSNAASSSTGAGSTVSSGQTTRSVSGTSTAASTTMASSSVSTGVGGEGGSPVIVDCTGCVPSPAGDCASDTVVVGHYDGGSHTVCIEQGDASPINLVLMSYDSADWALGGAVSRVAQLQIFSYEPLGSITGNAGVPTSIQIGGSVPADPYAYAESMGDCPAHTGYAGAVFGVPQMDVCHQVEGLTGDCSGASYTCLAIDP